MSEQFVVVGADGFIGRNLVRSLRARNIAVEEVLREDLPYLEGSLGHVIYAVGLTADFRKKPFETVDAHVGVLSALLRRIRFESFLYLSSTRVYAGSDATCETQSLSVQPANPDQLYNISKLMGEALCLTHSSPRCRVARLSNVIGADDRSENFLTSVLAEAVGRGSVVFQTSQQSARDFIEVDDVCRVLSRVTVEGKERLYNVASGTNVSNGEIAQLIGRLAGVRVDFAFAAPLVRYPEINIDRIRGEFSFDPVSFESSLNAILMSRQQTAHRP